MDYQVIKVKDKKSVWDKFYRISLEDLKIEEVSEDFLEDEICNNSENDYVNAYFNEIENEVEVNGLFTLSGDYPDITVNGVLLFDGDDIIIKGRNYKPELHDGYFYFGNKSEDFAQRINVGDNNVEDFRLVYAFRYKKFLCLRCLISLNYDDIHHFTITYDLEKRCFGGITSDNKEIEENLPNLKGFEYYMFATMVDDEFSELLSINYKVHELYE